MLAQKPVYQLLQLRSTRLKTSIVRLIFLQQALAILKKSKMNFQFF